LEYRPLKSSFGGDLPLPTPFFSLLFFIHLPAEERRKIVGCIGDQMPPPGLNRETFFFFSFSSRGEGKGW